MAATNSTTNLGLPQWEATDKPERTDFNTAMSDIDNTVAAHLADKMPSGYSGNVHGIPPYQTGSFSASISAAAGTITSASLTTGIYTKVGRKVTIYFDVVITTNGTGSNAVRIDSLPFQPVEHGYGIGRNVTNGDMLQVEVINVTGGRAEIRAYNNSYPGADGRTLRGLATYFATN